MIVKKLKSEGVAHLSYMVIDGTQAAVIDPRRDIAVYLDIACSEGANIEYIFETHRNEDYVVGSRALAEITGARVFHGPAVTVEHARTITEGEQFDVGKARLRVLETPGHTLDSISLVLIDSDSGDEPVGVFTGDTLFIGDVGRTDFYPERKEEMAGKLYDSIVDKLLPLGDGTIIYPAHGAGSVCGSGMADREFSTIGYERASNPMLQLQKGAFIEAKTTEHHYMPPYFRRMEQMNTAAPPVDRTLLSKALGAPAFEQQALDTGATVLDLRSPEAYCGAAIPGSLCMPVSLISGYGGWVIGYDDALFLIADESAALDAAIHTLYRMGYDNLHGHLASGVNGWIASGRDYISIPTVSAKALHERYRENADFVLLDVRTKPEFEVGHLPNAKHIYLGYLPERLNEVPRDKPVVTFCGSGKRAAVAASVLRRYGFSQVENCLGSMSAWKNLGLQSVEE